MNEPGLDPLMAEAVLQYTHPLLRQRCETVSETDFGTLQLAGWIGQLDRSRQTYRGIGIAAPQLGIMRRLIVIEIPVMERAGFGQVEAVPLHTLINPEIVWFSEDTIKATETCLSIAGYEGELNRPKQVGIVAFTPDGQRLEFEADGLYARCIQHEIDHLNGILYPDRISNLRDIRKVQPVEIDDPVLSFNSVLKLDATRTL